MNSQFILGSFSDSLDKSDYTFLRVNFDIWLSCTDMPLTEVNIFCINDRYNKIMMVFE